MAERTSVGTLPVSIRARGFPEVDARTFEELIRRLVQALQPDKIVLFGSYARGVATADSDVDLLIVMETTDPPAERYLRVSRLLRPRPFPVDILVRTPAEIRQALSEGDFFVREILENGLVLYERRS
ncbi:MAG: nucleotidyltransferase domain-containing protein [Thermoflexia bacterium]|nr:MAG: nucleotidyltransferase domain-containing protein [Thermoflexia bacterium]